MSRELFDVGYELGLLRLGSGAAYTAAKGDSLAGDFPLEGTEDEAFA
jgi:hypothetical protein